MNSLGGDFGVLHAFKTTVHDYKAKTERIKQQQIL